MSPVYAAYQDLPKLVEIQNKYAQRGGGGAMPASFFKKMISKLDVGIKIFDDQAFYIYRMKKQCIQVLRIISDTTDHLKLVFLDIAKMILSSGRHTVILNVPPADLILCSVLKDRNWYAYCEQGHYIKFRYNYSTIPVMELENWWVL